MTIPAPSNRPITSPTWPPRTAPGFTITNVRSTMPSPCHRVRETRRLLAAVDAPVYPRLFVLCEVLRLALSPPLAALRAGPLPFRGRFSLRAAGFAADRFL